MPRPPDQPGADALAMARAILGSAVRIVGASFSGNAKASGLSDDGRAVLSTGIGGGAKATSYIDIDFVAETDEIALALALSADEIPAGSAETFLRDGLSIWVNGRRAETRAPAQGSVSTRVGGEAIPVASSPDSGVSVGFLARLGLSKGQVNTIRIATASLGLAAVFSTLTATEAEANNGKAVGNPGSGNNGNEGGRGNADNGHGQGGGGGGGNGGGGGTGGNYVANPDDIEKFTSQTITVDLTANDVSPGQSAVFITEINGQAVEVGDTVDIGDGLFVTLNADGTVTISGTSALGETTFTYSAAYGTGNAAQADTGTVTISTVPCFVAGTMIRTDRGDVPVERLAVGQMVRTRDDGLQPIRWIGRRVLPAEGRMAPVRIEKNTFGEHRALMVSPLHRVLVRNVHAELLFGSSEVLIAARDLIDGRRVRQIEGGLVEYVHILFDRHEVVWSEGLETESFLPGPQTTHCFEQETVAEICEIFPELDPATGAGYGPAARPALRAFEAKLLAG